MRVEERDTAADPDPALDRDGTLDDQHASDPEVIESDPATNPGDDQLKNVKGG